MVSFFGAMLNLFFGFGFGAMELGSILPVGSQGSILPVGSQGSILPVG